MNRIAAALICLITALPAASFDRPDPDRPWRIRELKPPSPRLQRVVPGEASAAGAATKRFVDKQGGTWSFHVDPRTGKAALILGSGVPLVPGPGNGLDASVLAGLKAANEELTARAIEPLVRRFVDEQAELLLPDAGEIRFDDRLSVAREDGRLISFRYEWWIDGLRVEGAEIFVRLNSGNITQFGSYYIGPAVVDTEPSLDAGEAYARLLEYSGDRDTARPEGQPELLIQVEAEDDLDFRLVWRFVYRTFGHIETWEGRVDARTGEIVSFRDTNRYARAWGGIYPRTVHDTKERLVPLPKLSLTVDGSEVVTDYAGNFSYAGGRVDSGLNGHYFDTFCVDCRNPTQPMLTVEGGTGRADFGKGGFDEDGNGTSTPADRNAYYHINQVRRVASHWLPNVSWVDTVGFPTVVNLRDTCNAVYTGSGVNFYRSGGGCNNTGLIADVVYHEWGHGLDEHTRPGDAGTGEGTADAVSMMMTHSPLIAPGFAVDGSWLRDMDSNTSSLGLLTKDRILAGACRVGAFESAHCVGQVFGQAAWDLTQVFVQRYGESTGWRLAERLFFTSLPDAGGWDPFFPWSIYNAYIVADDDDGNLANGTPNASDIYAAFAKHGIAGTRFLSSPRCARPVQPELTAAPSCGQVDLSWEGVLARGHYEVLRGELLEDTVFFPLAEVGPDETAYTDAEVAPGQPYWYVVMAVDAAGCESTIENPILAQVTSQPTLDFEGVDVTDIPRGNRSGFADPGEEVDLFFTLENPGEVGSAGVTGTVSPITPGVTMLDPLVNWPPIAPHGVARSLDTVRFETDAELISCGDLIEFRLDPDDATGCGTDPAFVRFRIGEPDGLGGFQCDLTPACYTEPDFSGANQAQAGGSCGEVDLGWSAASSNCTNATISYNVYRDVVPDFIPSSRSLVAAGIDSLSYVDSLLAPGTTYHYIVRAFDSRSGEDSNLARVTSAASSGADTRPPVFAGIAAIASGGGCGEVELSWPHAGESCGAPVTYQVYRSLNPAFTPGPTTLIGSTLATSYVDAALPPGFTYTYVVQAVDTAGNVDGNLLRWTGTATRLDRIQVDLPFEADDGGWTVGPDSASQGYWAWGNPQGTDFQPEDDATPGGVNCWMTGLGREPDNDDVDDGVTVLQSPSYDLTDLLVPTVRYARWFTNDRGASPGEPSDVLRVDVSADDGQTWVPFEVVGAGTPLEWLTVERALPGIVTPTELTRFRFTAADLNDGSLVEAGIDDFLVFDPDQGCEGCDSYVEAVGQIQLSRSGEDVVLSWVLDPAPGDRFIVYKLTGEAFETAIRIGSTESRTFVHERAAMATESFAYRVTAVDRCGNESALVDDGNPNHAANRDRAVEFD